MKSQVYNKSYKYPSYWSDDDKINFDLLVKESKRIYPDMDDYLINLAVHHYINVGLVTYILIARSIAFNLLMVVKTQSLYLKYQHFS